MTLLASFARRWLPEALIGGGPLPRVRWGARGAPCVVGCPAGVDVPRFVAR